VIARRDIRPTSEPDRSAMHDDAADRPMKGHVIFVVALDVLAKVHGRELTVLVVWQ